MPLSTISATKENRFARVSGNLCIARGPSSAAPRNIGTVAIPFHHRTVVALFPQLDHCSLSRGAEKFLGPSLPRGSVPLLPTFPARVSSSGRSADVYLARQAGDRRAGIDPRCSFFGSSNRLIFTLHRVPNTFCYVERALSRRGPVCHEAIPSIRVQDPQGLLR